MSDALLDYIFCGEKTVFEEFWDCIKDSIMEQEIAEEKRKNE